MNLDSCTPGQRESVMRVDGPLLVSAGAGSGKTFTLTQRIAYALLPESGPAAGGIDEVLAIGNNFNGGTRMHYDRQARNRFNDALKDNGGKRMDRLVYYFSSTEKDEKEAYTTHTGIEPPYVIEIPKYNKFLVRAVRKF